MKMENFKKCDYRNCNKDISKMRKGTIYCSRNCKSCEYKYLKREDIKDESNKKNIVEMLKNVNMDMNIIKLFELINNK